MATVWPIMPHLSVLILSGGILTVMAEKWRIRHKDENLDSQTMYSPSVITIVPTKRYSE